MNLLERHLEKSVKASPSIDRPSSEVKDGKKIMAIKKTKIPETLFMQQLQQLMNELCPGGKAQRTRFAALCNMPEALG